MKASETVVKISGEKWKQLQNQWWKAIRGSPLKTGVFILGLESISWIIRSFFDLGKFPPDIFPPPPPSSGTVKAVALAFYSIQ